MTLKSDDERVERRTHNIGEERADGFTQRLVDDDGSESGGCRWTNTSTTSCLQRTQRKFESSSALECVRCEKTWLRMAQVTPSTEFALRKCVESLTWVVTQSGACSSFVRSKMRYTMKNAGVVGATMAWVASSGGVDGFDGGGFDGFDGVDGGSDGSDGGFDGVDGVDGWRRWWTGVFDTEGTDVEVPLCPQW